MVTKKDLNRLIKFEKKLQKQLKIPKSNLIEKTHFYNKLFNNLKNKRIPEPYRSRNETILKRKIKDAKELSKIHKIKF